MTRVGRHLGFYQNTDGLAQRYWVHDRILVGGSIMNPDDGEELRRIGITHVLSAEDQQDDAGKWPDEYRARHAFVDDGADVDLDLVHKMIGYAKAALVVEGSTLYVHCKMGGSRGPTLGYLALRTAFEFSPARAMDAIRIHRGAWTPHLRYIHSVERAITARDGEVNELLAWVRVMEAYRATSRRRVAAAIARGSVHALRSDRSWRRQAALGSRRPVLEAKSVDGRISRTLGSHCPRHALMKET